MLAVAGWAAVDGGARFPGSPYGSILNSVSAHTASVENGSLGYERNIHMYMFNSPDNHLFIHSIDCIHFMR